MRRATAALGEFLLEPVVGVPGATEEGGERWWPGSKGGPPGPATEQVPAVVLASAIGTAGDAASLAAAVGIAAASGEGSGGALLIEVEPRPRRRGPTMFASEAARELEDQLRALGGPYASAAARGHLCWLPIAAGEDPLDRVAELLEHRLPVSVAIVHLPQELWPSAIADERLRARSGLLRADLPADRALAALAVRELRERGLRARVASDPLGRVGSRRALAGIEPGGAASHRAARLARGLVADQSGQGLPLVLGAAAALIFVALILTAIGGAITGKGRTQRAADLAAVSGARSMRDDFERLFAPTLLSNGAPNPAHLTKREYLGRARLAARQAADRNGVRPSSLRIRFPDAESFAPLRVRARVEAQVERETLPGSPDARRPKREIEIVAGAVAEASVPAEWSGMPSMASGGGYSGPLVYRQGEGMRPDVATAFDRMAAAARRDGISLVVNSGFRSDAEQAKLFAQNPNPTMVAPPGKSLHRCATELDLGPPSAYRWLARNARRFGFVKRYSWEPWHFGFVRGPAPCSEAANSIGASDGESASSGGLPSFVPARYRGPILRSAARWNVSAALLAAQLFAESNFNPNAVSPAGAQGIAQFMPATARAYGLRNPFNASAAINAQAHLMSDLLRQFRSVPLALAAYNAGPGAVAACRCVPPYPETRAYVARILGLLDGAGALLAPELEVRLVE